MKTIRNIVGVWLVLSILIIGTGWISSFAFAYPHSELYPVVPYHQNNTITLTASANNETEWVELYYYWQPFEGLYENPYYGKLYKTDLEAPWEFKFSFPKGNGEYKFYTVSYSHNDSGMVSAGPPVIEALCEYRGESFIVENIWIISILALGGSVVVYYFIRKRDV